MIFTLTAFYIRICFGFRVLDLTELLFIMRPLSELKQDFEVSRGLRDIIDVLKTAAMIQFRSFQLREKLNEDFIKELESCFGILAAKNINHPYLFDRKSLPSIIVVLTSD